MNVPRVWAATLGLALTLSAGCDEETGGGGGTNVDFDASYECCLNGAFYECGDAESVGDCGAGDTSGCSRDSGRDNEC